jgi:Flp pilus assembly protein TadD
VDFRNQQADAVGVMSMDGNCDRSSLTAKDKRTLGVKLFGEGQFRDALTKLEEALGEVETVPADFWNDWGAVAFACGDFQKAESGFRKALELNPDDGQAATIDTLGDGTEFISRCGTLGVYRVGECPGLRPT